MPCHVQLLAGDAESFSEHELVQKMVSRSEALPCFPMQHLRRWGMSAFHV